MRSISPRWLVIGLLLLLWAAWSVARAAEIGGATLTAASVRSAGLAGEPCWLPPVRCHSPVQRRPGRQASNPAG